MDIEDIKDLDLTITVQIYSKKHDCNVAFMLRDNEIKEYTFHEILEPMIHEIKHYIQGKENAISKREESKNSQGVF